MLIWVSEKLFYHCGNLSYKKHNISMPLGTGEQFKKFKIHCILWIVINISWDSTFVSPILYHCVRFAYLLVHSRKHNWGFCGKCSVGRDGKRGWFWPPMSILSSGAQINCNGVAGVGVRKGYIHARNYTSGVAWKEALAEMQIRRVQQKWLWKNSNTRSSKATYTAIRWKDLSNTKVNRCILQDFLMLSVFSYLVWNNRHSHLISLESLLLRLGMSFTSFSQGLEKWKSLSLVEWAVFLYLNQVNCWNWCS